MNCLGMRSRDSGQTRVPAHHNRNDPRHLVLKLFARLSSAASKSAEKMRLPILTEQQPQSASLLEINTRDGDREPPNSWGRPVIAGEQDRLVAQWVGERRPICSAPAGSRATFHSGTIVSEIGATGIPIKCPGELRRKRAEESLI